MVLKNAICCSYLTTFATTSLNQRLKNKFNSIFSIELFKPQTKLKLNDTFFGYIFWKFECDTNIFHTWVLNSLKTVKSHLGSDYVYIPTKTAKFVGNFTGIKYYLKNSSWVTALKSGFPSRVAYEIAKNGETKQGQTIEAILWLES